LTVASREFNRLTTLRAVDDEKVRPRLTLRDRRPRVVLADDHPSVLTAFGRLLTPRCDVVTSVLAGHAAIEAVTNLRPDVLVVDLMMPDLNGLEVCRRVKAVAPDTAVVIVTAFDDQDVRKIALQDGASAFVPKHSAPSTLEDTILQIVAAKSHLQP
jgi:two-component system, NarL family, response regulator LiaR